MAFDLRTTLSIVVLVMMGSNSPVVDAANGIPAKDECIYEVIPANGTLQQPFKNNTSILLKLHDDDKGAAFRGPVARIAVYASQTMELRAWYEFKLVERTTDGYDWKALKYRGTVSSRKIKNPDDYDSSWTTDYTPQIEQGLVVGLYVEKSLYGIGKNDKLIMTMKMEDSYVTSSDSDDSNFSLDDDLVIRFETIETNLPYQACICEDQCSLLKTDAPSTGNRQRLNYFAIAFVLLTSSIMIN